MRTVFHRSVYSDLIQILNYYESATEPVLAAEFYDEFRSLAIKAAERPETFQADKNNIRRVNLSRFPYHFLFRITDDSIRILVVRHDRRHPSFGSSRR